MNDHRHSGARPSPPFRVSISPAMSTAPYLVRLSVARPALARDRIAAAERGAVS